MQDFLGGGALVPCCTSIPINHIVFFVQNTSFIRKLQVISGGGGGGGGGGGPPPPPPRPRPPQAPSPQICQCENDRGKAETIANDRLFRQVSVRPAPACFNKVKLGPRTDFVLQQFCNHPVVFQFSSIGVKLPKWVTNVKINTELLNKQLLWG